MSQHVQDAAVFERRLRPIYDNLEVGNNRKALQETEKLLKKQPNLLCARALKGLALLRLGRYEESNQYLQPLTEEKSVDDATLQVLSFCYKELEQLDKIVELYDHAVKESPGNEELLAHLFISHVRIEDFKAQQTSAWQLYKAHPKNAYYFWAVMSVVLQGIRGPESKNPDKRKLFLELAQRMVEKMIKENKLESEQEAMLYLNILKMQDKYEQALSFLNDNSRHLTHSTPVSIKIDLLKKVERWQEVQILLMELLTEERDRWDYYQDFLTACFHLLKTAKENPTRDGEDNVDAGLGILDTCHDFICQKIEAGAKKMRGPYLARLELHKRMRAENLDAQALLGDFSELVIEYFRLFGDKTCCTHDITLFLQSIGMKERQELASKLLLESGISSTTLPQNKEQMQKHICALQISRICGSHIDLEKEHLLAFYTALKLHYEHGLRSFGQNLLPTDMGPSDPYALLAANVMYDISLKEQRSDHLFEALCLLQYVLRNSTSNFHVKLLSLKIYHMFGCVLGAQEMYDYLDIKQIQLDSMGYIHCNLLPLSGRFSLARTLFDSTLKFFSNSYKERLEYITLTYRFCSFNKLEEFMNFKERLTNSLHYVRASVEAQLCDFVTLYGNFSLTHTGMSVDPAEERILWDDLHDNRDLSAIVRWDPLHLVNVAEERTESFTQEKEVLRIRSLLLRLISSFVDLYNQPFVRYMKKPGTTNSNSNSSTPSSNNANANSNSNSTHNSNHADENNHHQESPAKDTETIEMLHDKWIALFQRLRSLNYKPLSNRFLVNLLPTSLHLLLDMPYEKFFADMSQLVLDFYNGDHNLPLQCSQMSKNVVDVVELCSQAIAESNCACKDGLWRRREWQSKVAAGVEMLCLYAFVLSTLQEKMQSSSRPKAKRKSTENNQQQQPYVKEKERSQLLSELMRQLKKKLEICENDLQNWKSPSLPRDLNSFMSDMSLTPEVEATLIGDVATVFRTSHEHMVTELKGLIKEKMRLMTK